jgi:hypothetical protein
MLFEVLLVRSLAISGQPIGCPLDAAVSNEPVIRMGRCVGEHSPTRNAQRDIGDATGRELNYRLLSDVHGILDARIMLFGGLNGKER